jgi:eukaryotic-like serine/threonine-protein kinase
MYVKDSNTIKSNMGYSLYFVVATFILAFYYLWFSSLPTNFSSQHAAGLAMTSNNFLTYESPVYGFKIQYPSDWERIEFSREVEEGNRKIIVNFLSPLESPSDTFREYFIIERGTLESHTALPLQSSVNTYITSLKSLPNFKIIESNTVSFAQSLAMKLVYSYNNPEVGVTKTMDMLTIKNDKLYLLSFNSDAVKYNNYLPTIQKMLDLFRFS